MEELAAQVPRRTGPRTQASPLCLCWGLGAVLAACVLCMTLPSRGPVLSVPREPQPKCRRWWGRKPMALSRAWQTAQPPAGSFPGGWKASAVAPPSPPLQAAFLLPQCLMPGHTATKYAIRVGHMPTCPHPHPRQPLDPKGCSCHSLPSALPAYLSSH